MKIKFVDTELIAVQPVRKNGRVKYECVTKEVEDQLIQAIKNPFNPQETLWVRESKLLEAKQMVEKGLRGYLDLYHITGILAQGLWQHGRQGSKIHQEPVIVEYRKEGRFNLVSTCSYASGQIKDQLKYLKGIK